MIWACWMVCSDFFAESSCECLKRLRAVGIAISMIMVMIAITISNSIRVKPLGRTGRRARLRRLSEDLQFMGFELLREQASISWPFRKNATTYRREREIQRS